MRSQGKGQETMRGAENRACPKAWRWEEGVYEQGVQRGQWSANSRRWKNTTSTWKTEVQWRQVAAEGSGTIFMWPSMGSSPRTWHRSCDNHPPSTNSRPTHASKDFSEELGTRVPLHLQLILSPLNTAVSTPQGKIIARYEFAISDHPWCALTENGGRGDPGFAAACCRVSPFMGVNPSLPGSKVFLTKTGSFSQVNQNWTQIQIYILSAMPVIWHFKHTKNVIKKIGSRNSDCIFLLFSFGVSTVVNTFITFSKKISI